MPTGSKFIYSCSIKFLPPAGGGNVFSAKNCRDTWRSGWWEVRWIWQMRQNFVAQFVQLLKHWLCDLRLGIIIGKNWVLSVDQCKLHGLQFSVHLIDLLRLLLRYNDFARTQKAIVDQTSSRPPKSDYDLFFFFFLVQVWLWKYLEPLPGLTSELVSASCIHFLLRVTNQSKKFSLLLLRVREVDTSKWRLLWFSVSAH